MSEIKRNGHGAMDMTQGSPTRLIVLFSLPLLAGNVLQQLYNMVDSVVVGNYVGSSALTAVGAGFSIMFLISSLFLGFSMGATIMIAQYVGAGDQGAVGRTVDTIYSALLVIIVPLTLLGVLASGPAAHPDPGARRRPMSRRGPTAWWCWAASSVLWATT